MGEALASQIAAGEVIERPASVVKELVENALDAGARRIEVEARGGGAELLRVSDDGAGIPEAELRLALTRHGTSKLVDSDGLWRIATLGFRGEALPSIAAVSRLEILSRPADQPAGAWVTVEGGQTTGSGARAHPGGTVVAVRDLFYNVPVRRKYLRSAGSEHGAIATLLTTYTLAYPDVVFRLTVEGQVVFHSPGTGAEADAVARVLGAAAARAMVPVHSNPIGGATEPGTPRVRGRIGLPPLSRGNRAALLLFVNGRPVTSRTLQFAVADAYRHLLPEGRFPIAVLHIDVPPEEVDVNVHPAKAEVRFLRDRLVFATVQRAVQAALSEHVRVPEVDPWDQGQGSAAGQGSVDGAGPGEATSPPWPRLWSVPTGADAGATNGPAPAGVISATAASGGGDTGAVEAPAPGRLPPLRVLGQMSNLFIIAEGPDGMYLIDQHAAHERITYDRLRRERRAGAIETQMLLEPLLVELSTRALAGLDERLPRYGEWGLDVTRFGEAAVLVRSVPAALRASDLRRALAELVEETAGPDEMAGTDWEERMLISLACRQSIRGNQPLAPAEQRELIAQLEATEMPHTCPHGRPITVLLTQSALERQFGRR